MPQHNWFAGGEWNAQCDQCGFVFKSSQLFKRWDNAMTCRGCWETRHPQDFVRGIPDKQNVPWARPWMPLYLNASTVDATAIGNQTLGTNPDGL
jgi:hypothetical protein